MVIFHSYVSLPEGTQGGTLFGGAPPVIKWVIIPWLVGGDWNMAFVFPGMSSSQLTKSIIFQRGRYTTNQVIIPWKLYITYKP